MKDLRWPHMVVVLGALAAVSWLTYTGKDSAVILLLLGALGFVVHQQAEIKQQTETIKQQTNGTNTELLQMIDRLQREKAELALKVPTDSETPPSQD